jgi:signal transduction histidine kinase
LIASEGWASVIINRYRYKESTLHQWQHRAGDSLQLEEVLTRGDWQSTHPRAHWGESREQLWLKTIVHNELAHSHETCFLVRTVLYQSIDAMILRGSQLEALHRFNPQSPLWLKQIPGFRPAFCLLLAPGEEYTVVLKVQTASQLSLDILHFDLQSFRWYAFTDLILELTLLLVTLILASLALILGFIKQQSSLLLLSLWILAQGVYSACLLSWPVLALFPWPTHIFQNPANILLVVGLVLQLLLILHLVPQNIPWLRSWPYIVSGVFGLGAGLTAILSLQSSIRFAAVIISLATILILVVWIATWRQSKIFFNARLTLLLHGLVLSAAFYLAPWLPDLFFNLGLFTILASILSSVCFLLPTIVHSYTESTAQPSREALSPSLLETWSASPQELDRLQTLGTFAGGLVRELNNPLAIIAGHRFRLTTLLEQRTLDAQEMEKSLVKIDQSVNRMLAVLDALKAYAEHPEQKTQAPTISLRDTIRMTLDLCRERMTQQGIRFTLAEIPDLKIAMHQGQLMHAMLQVLQNAIEATAHIPSATISLSCETSARLVILRIQDGGSGVPSELRERIWEPFFTTKDPFLHKGLGLSIARSLVQRYKGRLTLDSSRAGSCFAFEFQRVDSAS